TSCFDPIFSTFLSFLFRSVSVCLLFFFFFSSRRRHTRWPRDWSSDVCSSDLSLTRVHGARPEGHESKTGAFYGAHLAVTAPRDRSEERRVGKECRSRWSP